MHVEGSVFRQVASRNRSVASVGTASIPIRPTSLLRSDPPLASHFLAGRLKDAAQGSKDRTLTSTSSAPAFGRCHAILKPPKRVLPGRRQGLAEFFTNGAEFFPPDHRSASNRSQSSWSRRVATSSASPW